MGYGYRYRCASCGYEDEVLLGVGAGHSREVGEIYRGFQLGTFGTRMRRVFRKSKLAAVRANHDIFVCEDCGCWSVIADPSIWEPNDPDAAAAEASRSKDPLWEWDVHPAFIDTGAWHLACTYEPACPKCRGKMRSLGLGEEPGADVVLACPECGAENHFGNDPSMFRWD